MALSKIAPYPLPQITDVPPSRAPWEPDPKGAVLLVHDVQRYFLAPFQVDQPPLSHAVANIKTLCEACRAAEIPVVFSAQPGEQDRADRGLLWDLWGPGIISQKELDGFLEDVRPLRGDLLLHKRRYSAFFGTELEEEVRQNGRSQLWITGVYGHIGCLATATDAFMRGIQPFVVADATADFSREDHLSALRLVARTCGVVSDTQSLLGSLRSAELSNDATTAIATSARKCS